MSTASVEFVSKKMWDIREKCGKLSKLDVHFLRMSVYFSNFGAPSSCLDHVSFELLSFGRSNYSTPEK